MNRSLLLSAGAFVVLCVGGRLSAQGPVQLTDNFDNGAIDPPLVISNYVQEDYGTFAPGHPTEHTRRRAGPRLRLEPARGDLSDRRRRACFTPLDHHLQSLAPDLLRPARRI